MSFLTLPKERAALVEVQVSAERLPVETRGMKTFLLD
jgi:hypothetical protein